MTEPTIPANRPHNACEFIIGAGFFIPYRCMSLNTTILEDADGIKRHVCSQHAHHLRYAETIAMTDRNFEDELMPR
jgi:hypothetical protein